MKFFFLSASGQHEKSIFLYERIDKLITGLSHEILSQTSHEAIFEAADKTMTRDRVIIDTLQIKFWGRLYDCALFGLRGSDVIFESRWWFREHCGKSAKASAMKREIFSEGNAGVVVPTFLNENKSR